MFDIELTKYLAELSKIAFTDDELEKVSLQMTDIINLMDMVKDFESGDKPFAPEPSAYTDLREDLPQKSFETGKILQNAEKIKNNSFVVPKVVGS